MKPPEKHEHLPEQHIQLLADRLADGQLTVFVGAGLSHLALAQDGSNAHLPLWKELTASVARRCHVDPRAFDHNALDIFDHIVFGQERSTLEEAIREALDDRNFEPSPAHTELSRLPWRAVVTTNYDRLLQRVFKKEPVATERDYARISRSSDTSPTLFQLHGNLQHPHTLTRDDFREWPVHHPRAFHHLKEILLNGTALFVGYSLSDPHIDNLLATIRRITGGQNKRLFGWFWKIAPEKAALLDRRDKIEARSINSPESWQLAFRQLYDALVARQASTPCTVVLDTNNHVRDETASYDRAQYLSAMHAHFGFSNLSPIYTYGPGYTRSDITLEEIFVEPDLVQLSSSAKQEWFADNTVKARSADYEATTKSPLRLALEMVEESIHEKAHREPATSWFEREPRLIVMAGPGQGKSTLLRVFLLRACRRWEENPSANPLPVYVRLCDWESLTEPSEGRLITYVRQVLPQLGEVSSRQVDQWVGGPILWLLDGLDEIRDRHERERLYEEVAAVTRMRPADHWIITTRPSGRPVSDFVQWCLCEMPPFTDPQVESFLDRWKTVLEEKERVEIPIRQMQDGLRRDPGLRRLQGNALILTLAVLFYKGRRRLPQDRWEFYEAAEQLLRDAWVQHRLRRSREYLPGSYLPDLLQNLALRGMVEGEVVFTRGRLEREARDLMKARGFTAAEQEREIDTLIAAAEDLIGVLVAEGDNRFSFQHLSFQEYLAARYISRQSGEAQSLITQYWDHPDWSNVWPLYLLAVQSDSARREELFASILASEHSLDRALQRPRLFCLELAGIATAPLSPTTRKVFEWASGVVRTQTPAYLYERCVSIISVFQRPIPEELKDLLLARLNDKDERSRIYAIKGLRSVASEKQVVALFMERLDDSYSVRLEIIEALTPVSAEPSVTATLIELLQSKTDEVRWAATHILGHLSNRLPVRNSLLARLHDNNTLVRREAARALAQATSDERCLEALLCQLYDRSSEAREGAAFALASAATRPSVQQALLARFQDTEPVRKAAALSLSKVAHEPAVREALLERLRSEDFWVRAAALGALGQVAATDPQVKAEVLRIARDERMESIRLNAERILRAVSDPVARTPTESTAPRRIADQVDEPLDTLPISRLVKLASSGDVFEVEDEVFTLDLDDESVPAESQTQLPWLALLSDEDPWVRLRGVNLLARASPEPPVLEALTTCLYDDESIVYVAAAEALRLIVLRERQSSSRYAAYLTP